MKIQDYIKKEVLLFDGAMGSYFSGVYSDPFYRCEYANLSSPHTVREIHLRYLEAGAKAIKTNTFSLYSEEESNEAFSPEKLLEAGFRIATEVAEAFQAYVFCDIGPIPDETPEKKLVYEKMVDQFISLGGKYFIFETFHQGEMVNHLAEFIKKKVPDAFVLASFAIDAEGFSKEGQTGTALLENLSSAIDSAGFNCVCGPKHMISHVKQHRHIALPRAIMPNASYPTVVGHRLCFDSNPDYFAREMREIVEEGAVIVGGCCGTTPAYIQAVREILDKQTIEKRPVSPVLLQNNAEKITESSFYQKLVAGEKPIAVEFDSPMDTQISAYLEGAKKLKQSGVDMITIADCPVARARMDSSLLACKLRRELDIPVMPHMTCRDRNINATRALLLGCAMEEITDVLVVTGDPIPTAQRKEVKAVFEFNSRLLTSHIKALNHSVFPAPFYLYAALNLNATNIESQLAVAKKKIECGTVAFFTQPVLSQQGFENLKRAKEVLSVPLVVGILPIVSHRNATFINNEIPGITVCEEIVERYLDKEKDECTQEAIYISTEIAKSISPYLDGYYLITPFTRVDVMVEIIKNIKDI